MDISTLAVTILLTLLNAAFAIALDRSPSGHYQIGAVDEDGLYPIIEAPTGWRRFRRPACLYATIATGIGITVVPLLIH